MSGRKKFLASFIVLLSMATAVSASEITYIDSSLIENAAEGESVSDLFGWDYLGSAANVTHNIVQEDGVNCLSLESDGLKNGYPGGTYYLYNTFYPVIGEGSISFDLKLNSGSLSLGLGDSVVTSSLYHEAFNLEFNAENNSIMCDDTVIDGVYECNQWYNIDISFDIKNHELAIKTDLSETVLPFSDENIFFISNLTFYNSDKFGFDMDIKDIQLVNSNSTNGSGGSMEISSDNIMKATYPESAEVTQTLMDNITESYRKMEYLDRGLVAVMREDDVYLSWRWLGTEDISTGYNIYRNGVKINDTPVYESTNYIDHDGDMNSRYTVRSVVDGSETDDAEKDVGVNASNEIKIPLVQYDYENYSSGDGMVGDLDGDGEYEIIVHRYPEDVFASENYPLIEAYKLDGTHLWTMNIGPNDLEPKQNPVLVYDLDDDGKSEVVMRIGDDFIDGTGTSVGDMDNDGKTNYRDSVYSGQYLTEGPEYLAVFDGETGEIIDKVPYEGVVARDPISQWGNGNNITHRPWKFMFAPIRIDDDGYAFAVCRGIYAKTGIQCWKLNGDKLEMIWDFNSDDYFSFSGQGNHNLSSGDVDFDGYDELIYGGMAVDHNGTPMYTTGLGHGDAIHLGDFVIDRPGLEVMKTNESETAYANCSMFDARTGEVLWGEFAGRDTTRVLCDDFDPRYMGGETYTNGKAFDSHGNVISSQGGNNFGIYWDGDLLRELNDDVNITKYFAYDDKMLPLFNADTCVSNNGTKQNCTIQADLFGDWREEVILPSSDGKYLNIYSTTCPTPYKLYTLMHDPVYRAGAAWQNNAYNQPPHTGFYWGYDTTEIPIPMIYTEHNGERVYSPYSGENRTYKIDNLKDTYYKNENNHVSICDGYVRTDVSGRDNTDFSYETEQILDGMSEYYDGIMGYSDIVTYITLPTTKTELKGDIRLISDDKISIKDISGADIDKVNNGIIFDGNTNTLHIPDNVCGFIDVSTNGLTQIFKVAGENYTRNNNYLYDTLDVNPLGSGSDFLDSRMNINGWKLNGNREDVSVITFADRSEAEKKRLVKIKNNSDEAAEFYLDKDKMMISGIATVEFELQLHNAKSEFSLMSSGKKSLSVVQDNDKLYADNILIADGLENTTSDGAIYKITAIMNFQNKTYDLILSKDGNSINTITNLSFYDEDVKGIDRISLSVEGGGVAGIDDIDINVYSGVYSIYDEEIDKLDFANTPCFGSASVISAVYDNNILTHVESFEVQNGDNEINLNRKITDDTDYRFFVWNSLELMQPLY